MKVTQKKKILAKLGCIAAHRKALLAIYSSKTMYLPGELASSKLWFYIFLVLFSVFSLPMFSLILAHTNDFVPKSKFVGAGGGLQFIFGIGAISGPILCSIFICLGYYLLCWWFNFQWFSYTFFNYVYYH